MKTFVTLATLALALAPFALSPAGADAPACDGGTANADGTCTYHGSFLVAFPLGTLGANTKQSGLDSFIFPSPGPNWFLVAHVDSTAETTLYDVDVHYYTAAGTHVDSQDSTSPHADHCDIATPQADQACLVPDFGASNAGLKVFVDAKEGASFEVTVTAYPPGSCPAAYPGCSDTSIY